MASVPPRTAIPPSRQILTRSASSDSFTSAATANTPSQTRQSEPSTPPTSATDCISISSTAPELEISRDAETEAESETEGVARRSSARARTRTHRTSGHENCNLESSTTRATYKSKKRENAGRENTRGLTRRRTISGDAVIIISDGSTKSGKKMVNKAMNSGRDGIEALDLHLPVKRSTRSSGEPVVSLTKKLNNVRKRGRPRQGVGLAAANRELKRLADTNEFAKIDTKPVVAEVWSNGKLVTGDETPPKKRVKVEAPPEKKPKEEEKAVEEVQAKKRGPKIWLNKGLYAGQDPDILNWFAKYSSMKRKCQNMPEYRPTRFLPLPMWNAQRLLFRDRDFKLPFDVCSPLPPGQPKPDEWRKVPKNRFVGDAAAAWKKLSGFDDFSSRCVCSPQSGCGESCQNRSMFYECDDGNCAAGRENCTNRAFADLHERRSQGGKYRIGVEVIKTADRGYGVRSNRCFEPHQIIVEYTGEIITEDECDRRMNEDYKDNECYYLMLFDQNMIIDATRGSIARFVNHSCEPNCAMVKWIVAGKPRMALFAGDRPIMTGEELTYDYNFDPFSAKNVQECRCGAENCRGILGPKPKDKARATIGDRMRQVVRVGKRKLSELLSGENDGQKDPKKRKIAVPVSKLASANGANAAKRLNRLLSKTANTEIKSRNLSINNESPKSKVLKTYGSKNGNKKQQTYLSSSRNSRTALGDRSSGKGKSKGNAKAEKKGKEKKPKEVMRSPRVSKVTPKAREMTKSKKSGCVIKASGKRRF